MTFIKENFLAELTFEYFFPFLDHSNDKLHVIYDIYVIYDMSVLKTLKPIKPYWREKPTAQLLPKNGKS